MADRGPEYIYLGFPLDQLMDQRCPFPGAQTDPDRNYVDGGITLPPRDGGDMTASTGNIIIQGRPGTGKSTLALQIALSCAESGYLAAFYSLELPPDKIMQKANALGWEDRLHPVKHMHNLGDKPRAEDLGRQLIKVLTQPKNCPAATGGEADASISAQGHCLQEDCQHPRVLLPIVSPRSISAPDESTDGLFWERLNQIENLLKGAAWVEDNPEECSQYTDWKSIEETWLRGKEKLCQEMSGDDSDPWIKMQRSRAKTYDRLAADCRPRFRVVCIDSLNVFGDRPLKRDQLFRVFDLLSRYKVLGVFVVEEAVARSADFASSTDDDTIHHLADVVISLKMTSDQGYTVRHFSVPKSRYQEPVMGSHAFKIVEAVDFPHQQSHEQQAEPTPDTANQTPYRERTDIESFRVYPSLHYVVRALSRDQEEQTELFDLGGDIMKRLLPGNLKRRSVVTLRGPRATLKSTIAVNFLAAGLAKNEHGLLVRLHDRVMKNEAPRLLNETKLEEWPPLAEGIENWLHGGKLSGGTRTIPGNDTSPDTDLVEIAFKSGFLMPEELVDTVRFLLNQRKGTNKGIQRVVIDDVGSIGLSYPFLRNSITAGDMFLTAFVHLMRIYGVDLVITGTTSELQNANEAVHQASAIADAVVTCDTCDVFGEKHVTICGEGLPTDDAAGNRAGREQTPGVIQIINSDDRKCFSVNFKHLSGLVGFNTQNIRRPGVALYCFEGAGIVHRRYNEDVRRLLETSFASQRPEEVIVAPFNSRASASVLDSLHVLKDSPLERTVIYTFDEFWKSEARDQKLLIELEDEFNTKRRECYNRERDKYLVPYYANVLLLAYNRELLPDAPECVESWKHVWELAQGIRKSENVIPFEMDRSARETRSCALLDAVLHNTDLGQRAVSPFFNGASEHLLGREYDQVKEFLEALISLARLSDKDSVNPEDMDDPDKFCQERQLQGRAGIYLCWYSQLRDLVYRRQDLADKLRVWALPGGGFSGDWYMGVLRSSLSYDLGGVVVNKLCSDIEDDKRYFRGVGLPTMKLFENDGFYAWCSAQQPLKDVLRIHDNARRRSNFTSYPRVRRALYRSFDVMVSSIDDSLDGHYEDLTRQIKSMLPETE